MAKSPFKKGHDIAIPNHTYAINALERHMDSIAAERLWIKLCEKCNVKPYTEDVVELEEIFKCMSKQGGKVGVTGSSLIVRLMSYNMLNR